MLTFYEFLLPKVDTHIHSKTDMVKPQLSLAKFIFVTCLNAVTNGHRDRKSMTVV